MLAGLGGVVEKVRMLVERRMGCRAVGGMTDEMMFVGELTWYMGRYYMM